MSEIGEIIKDLNLPKQLLDKSEALLKTLFGSSFEEFGGLIADQVRMRRFKNQIKIFEKAQSLLKEKKLDTKKVSLKVLAPLLEFSSYEEDEKLQEKWSNLVVNILNKEDDVLFQQNCIAILNKMSSSDAQLLDTLYKLLETKRQDRYDLASKRFEQFKNSYYKPPASPKEYELETFQFNIDRLYKDLQIQKEKLDFQISNLITLGLLKWEIDIDVSAKKSNSDPEDDDIDVDYNVYNNTTFVFTPLGNKFIQVCNNEV